MDNLRPAVVSWVTAVSSKNPVLLLSVMPDWTCEDTEQLKQLLYFMAESGGYDADRFLYLNTKVIMSSIKRLEQVIPDHPQGLKVISIGLGEVG